MRSVAADAGDRELRGARTPTAGAEVGQRAKRRRTQLLQIEGEISAGGGCGPAVAGKQEAHAGTFEQLVHAVHQPAIATGDDPDTRATLGVDHVSLRRAAG